MAILSYRFLSFKNLYLAGVPLLFVLGTYNFSQLSLSEIHVLSEQSPIFCVFHWISGYDCPGCGMTRSLISFFSGQFGYSFYFNPFGPLIGALMVLVWAALIWNKEFSVKNSFRAIPKPYIRLVLVIVGAWGIFRNL